MTKASRRRETDDPHGAHWAASASAHSATPSTPANAIPRSANATTRPFTLTPSEGQNRSRTPLQRSSGPSPAAHAASQRVSLMARALAHPSKPLAASTAAAAAVPAAPAAPAVATRLMLLEDGSAFGSWNDGCSLLLHPGARTLTMLLPDGSTLRSLAALVPSAARPKMAALLAFRNMLATGEHEAPVLDRDSWQGNTFTSTTTYAFARWGLHRSSSSPPTPLSPLPFGSAPIEQLEGFECAAAGMAGPILAQPGAHNAGFSPAVSHERDGSVVVSSMDARISLTLLPNAHWARLRYPLPLQRTVKTVNPLTGAMEYEYLYADFAQLLPVAAVPPRWKYPLQCALRASHVHQIEAEERRLEREETQRGGSTRADSPSALGSDSNASFAQLQLDTAADTEPLDLAMDLPPVRPLRPSGTSVTAAGLDWPDVAGHSVPLLHSLPEALPKDSLITCLWTADALYWTFVPASSSPSDGEQPAVSVCALVHVDQSCLVLHPNGFFHHFLEPSAAVAAEEERQTDTSNGTDSPAAAAAAAATGASMFASLSRSMQREQREQLATGGTGSLRKRIYAAGAVPRLSNCSGLNVGEAQYELGRIAAAAVRMRSHALGVLDQRATEAKEAARKIGALAALASQSQPGASSLRVLLSDSEMTGLAVSPHLVAASAKHEVLFSASIHERCMQRGLGEFTAFKDGRIKSACTNTDSGALECGCAGEDDFFLFFCFFFPFSFPSFDFSLRIALFRAVMFHADPLPTQSSFHRPLSAGAAFLSQRGGDAASQRLPAAAGPAPPRRKPVRDVRASGAGIRRVGFPNPGAET